MYLSATPDDSPQSSRWHALDGLRGVAILLVMLNHFTIYGMRAPQGPVDRLYYTVASAGWVGVDILFVLSGFLITGILLNTKAQPHYFRNFYSRRTLRIFPLYYGFLLVYFLGIPLVSKAAPMVEGIRLDHAWFWTYSINMPIAMMGWPADKALAHFWSLAVEEQFYLLWPLLVCALNLRPLMLVCVAAMLGALALRAEFLVRGYHVAAFVFTFARVDSFAIGACVAIALRQPGWRAGVNAWIRPVVGMAVLMLFSITAWRRGLLAEDPVVVTGGLSLLAFLSGAIIWELVAAPSRLWLSRLFSHPYLTFFGTHSYALYVFHHPLAIYMQQRWLTDKGFPLIWGSQLPGQVAYLVIGVLVSLALAMASW